MMYPIAIFILAGLCEIGGGYLIWLWLRDAQSPLLGMLGGILLITYGIIATFQVFPTFSRVYAAIWRCVHCHEYYMGICF